MAVHPLTLVAIPNEREKVRGRDLEYAMDRDHAALL